MSNPLISFALYKLESFIATATDCSCAIFPFALLVSTTRTTGATVSILTTLVSIPLSFLPDFVACAVTVYTPSVKKNLLSYSSRFVVLYSSFLDITSTVSWIVEPLVWDVIFTKAPFLAVSFSRLEFFLFIQFDFV